MTNKTIVLRHALRLGFDPQVVASFQATYTRGTSRAISLLHNMNVHGIHSIRGFLDGMSDGQLSCIRGCGVVTLAYLRELADVLHGLAAVQPEPRT
jgi:hypothetical protein